MVNFKKAKFLIFLTLLTGLSQVLGENFEKRSAMIPLRQFGFSDKRLQKYFNHLKRLEEEIERREQEKKNKAMLDEEARRRKIFEQYLLKFQRGSNVLRDFITNRF